jgi:hypothetical protein
MMVAMFAMIDRATNTVVAAVGVGLNPIEVMVAPDASNKGERAHTDEHDGSCSLQNRVPKTADFQRQR